MSRAYPTLLQLVGRTPLVRLDRIGRESADPAREAREPEPGRLDQGPHRDGDDRGRRARGKLKPGGTIVEPTSGNTGMGLAIGGRPRLPLHLRDAGQDEPGEDRDAARLRRRGRDHAHRGRADSPESYYSVSERLAKETPGGFKPDQYSNMSNPEAHYQTTGPEIWEQTGGELDAVVIAVGTGGTISGAGRYLKEKNPEVADRRRRSRGLGLHVRGDAPVPRRRDRQGHPAGDMSRESSSAGCGSPTATRSSRRGGSRARRASSAGGSAGTTIWAALKVAKDFGPEAKILTVLPDSGRSYLSKFYDDNWMLQYGFLERRSPTPTIEQVLRFKRAEEHEVPDLVTIASHAKVGAAID